MGVENRTYLNIWVFNICAAWYVSRVYQMNNKFHSPPLFWYVLDGDEATA